MKRAKYIIAHVLGREDMLKLVQDCILASPVPEGWDLDYIVSTGPGRTPGDNWNDCLDFCGDSDIILVTGDDDLQAPLRLAESVKAYEEGYDFFGVSTFAVVQHSTGDVAWWDGPPARAGAGMGYRAEILRKVGGWPSVPRGADKALWDRLCHHGYDEADIKPLSVDNVGRWTVYGDDGKGLSNERPYPARRETVRYGSFSVTGGGKWDDWNWSPRTWQALQVLSPLSVDRGLICTL